MRIKIIKEMLLTKSNCYALTVLIIGTVFSMLLYQSMLAKEKSVLYDKYLQRAEVHAMDIEAEFKRSFMQVSSVANLFSSSGWVSYSEFSDFVSRVFPNFPKDRRITTIHRFTTQEADNIINKIRENPEPELNNFTIFNYTAPKLSNATPINNYYSVISYTFPTITNENFIGRNIRPTSPIGPLIYPVFETKKPITSNLLKPVKGVRAKPFLLYIYPILNKNSLTQNLDGIITSSQYISDLFVHNVTGKGSDYFNYIIIDKVGNQYHYPQNKIIEKSNAFQTQKASLQFTFPIEVANNNFELVITPNDQQLNNTDSLIFKFFITAILLTLALAFITRFLLSQQHYLAQEVKRKTLAISTQKKQLKIQNFQLMDAVKSAEISAKAKSDFLANMSHEIRTPLNGVIGLTHLLKQTKPNELQQEYIDKLTFSGKHLLSVINDILDFSKIESGKVVLEQTAFSIYSVIDNLNMLFKQEAKEKGLDFTIAIEGEFHADLIGDVFRINQVLINLCANAIKFTETGNINVTISMSENKNTMGLYHVQFVVSDTGIGMEAHEIENLFKQFSQADSSTTRKYGGSGLGLSISQKLCHAMAGDITVASRKNKGSTFTATTQLELNENILFNKGEQGIITGKIDVLVVDDNLIALEILTNYLTTIGVNPITAQSAKEGLLALKSNEHDIKIIISDWSMPTMNGTNFVKEVTKLSLLPNPKIIIISAYETLTINNAKTNLPIDYVLQKPCPTNLLFETINHCLNKPTSVNRDSKISSRLMGVNLLVVEDNKINQLVIKKLLTNEGAIVTLANHGREAIALINQANQFQCILMDIHMPELDGIETTKIIRAHNNTHIAQLPIIALTANVLENDVVSYLNVGMNAHEAKPINIDNLVKTILPFLH